MRLGRQTRKIKNQRRNHELKERLTDLERRINVYMAFWLWRWLETYNAGHEV